MRKISHEIRSQLIKEIIHEVRWESQPWSKKPNWEGSQSHVGINQLIREEVILHLESQSWRDECQPWKEKSALLNKKTTNRSVWNEKNQTWIQTARKKGNQSLRENVNQKRQRSASEFSEEPSYGRQCEKDTLGDTISTIIQIASLTPLAKASYI